MNIKWKTEETRCIHKDPRDFSRCKIKNVKPGEYLCEHHKYDLASFVNDQTACIDIMAERFPKRHHPACDRKGENDCECHDYSRGASMMITMKAAFKESKLQSKLYQKHLKVTMADKVRRIKNYYRNITEDDVYLPPYSNFRQYRFFIWEPKSQRIVVKVLKDNVKTKKTLLSHLRRLAPIHVYYTTGQWLNPQGIGPDPESRKGLAKMRKKGWCAKESKKVTLKRYHNTMLKRDLYFDIDYDNKDYHQGIQMASELITAIEEHIHCYEFKNIKQQIVFSGGKGFHLIVNGYYDEAFTSPSKSYLFTVLRRERIKQGLEKETLLRYSCNHEDKNADIERHYKNVVTILQHETNLLLDWMVTYDNRRIIRLPGSVHGKSMRVCREINFSDDNVIKNRAGRPVGYIPDEPIP